MSISIYEASVPVFSNYLNNLEVLLRKGAEYADAQGIAPADFLGSRLAPDMHPLPRQVQISTDMAKGAVARLAEVERPVYEDNEATFDELYARIRKTIAFIESVDAKRFEGAESRRVSVALRGNNVEFGAKNYLLHFSLPNFFFHVTTAYAILRHRGVPLGKMDFIGDLRT